MTKTMTSSSFKSFGRKIMQKLGRIGGALLFPIAALPIAAILLRIGAEVPDTTGFSAFIQTIILKSGGVVFDNMPVIFAIGLAFGFTKDRRGEAAFVGFVGMVLLMALMGPLVKTFYGSINFGTTAGGDEVKGFEGLFGSKFSAVLEGNVLNGIIVGSVVAYVYNRTFDVEMPKVLGFFSGRRLVPAITILAVATFTILWAIVFPWIGYVIVKISQGLQKGADIKNGRWTRAGIMGAYGFMNRLLIPFGLHHIPNNLLWFQLGAHPDASSNIVVNAAAGVADHAPVWVPIALSDPEYAKAVDTNSFIGNAGALNLADIQLVHAVNGNSTIDGLQQPWHFVLPELAKATAAEKSAIDFINNNHIEVTTDLLNTAKFGSEVNGDIFVFLKGASKGNWGGIFQAGFFPTMMFGLPALVLAFAWTAENKVQKMRVLALFGSAAVVSFLTGITEPIEYAFAYVSPLLYLMHAILTGIFAFITGAFGVQLGFGFSAGFFDYLLSFNKALDIIKVNHLGVLTNPGWLIPIGVACGASYFFVGYFMIKKLNLNTPGRGTGVIADSTDQESEELSTGKGELSSKGKKIVLAYGGWDNIVEYQNCSTRLRYIVKDKTKVDDAALKKAGVIEVVHISDNSIQSIIGVQAESLNQEITSHIGEKLD